MLKTDNEGDFKIKFYAENRKEWKILRKKSLGWVTFLKEQVFGQKTSKN
jgi:hypothetical protein